MKHQREKQFVVLGLLAVGLFSLPGCGGGGGGSSNTTPPPADGGGNNDTSNIHPPASTIKDYGIGTTYYHRATTTYTYNASGQLLSSVETPDDGNNANKKKWAYAYNTNGQLASMVWELGVNELISRETTSYSYKANGQLDYEVTEGDYSTSSNPTVDGIIDTKDTTTYSYSANGQVTSSVKDNDFDNDGIIDSRKTYNYSYNADGRLTNRYIQYDSLNDGTIDGSSTETYSYNTSGQLVSDMCAGGEGQNALREGLTYTYNADKQLISTGYEYDPGNDNVDVAHSTYNHTLNTGVNYTPNYLPAGPSHRELYVLDFGMMHW